MTEPKRAISRDRAGRAALAAIVCLSLLWRTHAAAAELRLGFDDIAAMLERIAPIWSARIARDAGSSEGAGAPYVEFAAGRAERQTLAMRMPLPRVELAAGVYQAAPLGDLTGKLDARAQSGGLTLMVRHLGSVLIAITCVKGACPPQSVLPDIVWHDPQLTAEVAADPTGKPILGRFAVGGTFSASCERSWFPSSVVCEALRPVVERAVSSRATALAHAATGGNTQAAVPLVSGLTDAVRIAWIRADAAGVRVSFCLVPNCP